jgi:hypothetical protein
VARLRDDIDSAARAIAVGEQAVRDVGAIATEATAAVGQVLSGVERLGRVTEETAAAARVHGTVVRDVSGAVLATQRSLEGIGAKIRDIMTAAQRQQSALTGISVDQRIATGVVADGWPLPVDRAPAQRP